MMFAKINQMIEERFVDGDYIAINDENGKLEHTTYIAEAR